MSTTENAKTAVSAAPHSGNLSNAPPVATEVTSPRESGANGRVATPTIEIPKHTFVGKHTSKSNKTPRTPKTPADEGIEFFESAGRKDAPIQVYELKLDPDGGPSKDKAVSKLSTSAISGLLS